MSGARGFAPTRRGVVGNRKKKLLLVDDDLNQLLMRKTIFELSGYAVSTAADARGCMQLFETEMPDAVVLDYDMPVINGGVLARSIRRANRKVPIVMLSGCISIPRSALTAVDIFIRKPAAPSLLIDAVESLVLGHEVSA